MYMVLTFLLQKPSCLLKRLLCSYQQMQSASTIAAMTLLLCSSSLSQQENSSLHLILQPEVLEATEDTPLELIELFVQ